MRICLIGGIFGKPAEYRATVQRTPETALESGLRDRGHSVTTFSHFAPVRLVQVIARLNIGGPSIHVLTLTKRLEPFGYQATLVRGQEGRREGNMDHLARELGVEPVRIPSLQREPGWHDLRALVALIRIMRSERPHVVHTHAAKGGTLGRSLSVNVV